ncbi:carboxylesterase 1-like [Melia azedarach]|uniref:Carboxylesterase 1-like n=2 Tax=Melia azedarach TaxID=155640 RepID=A0ACC1Y0K9_MELAZ|nr:carboxylesterase 1-like [Melia azedarach]KAJ4717247.1 carboxylesterase 1-like [Melia azedarach]
MSKEIAQSQSTVDPFELLQIVPNPDGTITRNMSFLLVAADPVDNVVRSKDVPLNQSNNTWVRIFLPRQAFDFSSTTKLPLIIEFHTGGFIIGGAAISLCHEFSSNITLELPAVVVSVEYRLAPEHRLPAAYDDAMEVLHWIKNTQEDWLMKYADFSNCFLMGSSAGGNIAYQAGIRATSEVDNLLPLKIRGLILLYPFFGGVKRTESEIRLVNDRLLPTCLTDLMWELSLPTGSDRDHEYSNPTLGGGSKIIEKIRLLGWKVMVSGCDGDPLIDRQVELAKIMEKEGVEVVSYFEKGHYHGAEVLDPAKRKELLLHIKKFLV